MLLLILGLCFASLPIKKNTILHFTGEIFYFQRLTKMWMQKRNYLPDAAVAVSLVFVLLLLVDDDGAAEGVRV